MKPDIFIINPNISYRNKLKGYLELGGYERVFADDSIDSACEGFGGCIVLAQGGNIRYSDILEASGEGTRFILTYSDGGFSQADVGLAKSARCVLDGDFEYLLKLVNEECESFFGETSTSPAVDIVRDTLDGLGFNPAHKGYTYLIFAAKISRGEMITKDVYPDIAKKYKTTAGAVERSIRSATSFAWSNRGFGRFNRYIDWNSAKCPTNSELLLAINTKLRLSRMCEDDAKPALSY